MRREFLVGGTILGIIGGLIFFLGIVKLPFEIAEPTKFPRSDVWLDESFVVPEFLYYNYSNSEDFPSGKTLHITFNVTGGESLSFWVMNETDFINFNACKPYGYYTVPSRLHTSSLDTLWNQPLGKIYFVWDNTASSTSKLVSAIFYLTWTEWEYQKVTIYGTLFPTEASYLGIILLVGGLAIVGYGFASKPSPKTPKTTDET